jgi:hypothetical protein
MPNERTIKFRRQFRRAYVVSVVTLFAAVSGIRVIELGYDGEWLLPVILIAAVGGLIFFYSAGLAFAYLGELKGVALVENQRAYGGGKEFVRADDARAQVGQDNIWGP